MLVIAHPCVVAANVKVSIVVPTGEIPLKVVAQKDVPHGLPFRYIEQNMVPRDAAERAVWELDFSTPDGYGGA